VVGWLLWLGYSALNPTTASPVSARFKASSVSSSSGVPVGFGPGRREINPVWVCESLDGPMGDGIREAERADPAASGERN
jgi:hypothetical protein